MHISFNFLIFTTLKNKLFYTENSLILPGAKSAEVKTETSNKRKFESDDGAKQLRRTRSMLKTANGI